MIFNSLALAFRVWSLAVLIKSRWRWGLIFIVQEYCSQQHKLKSFFPFQGKVA